MGGLGLSSSQYHLLPVDLRESPERSLSTLIQSHAESVTPILRVDVPTLFLAECVLVYMAPEESSAVLQWFSSCFQV
jgi:O-methyltransferase involved in polyketide biosynthesis